MQKKLDVCALPKQNKFCDPDGYDIIPICMLRVYLDPDYDSSIEEYYELDHESNRSRSPVMQKKPNSSLQNNDIERQIGQTLPSTRSWPTKPRDIPSRDKNTISTIPQYHDHDTTQYNVDPPNVNYNSIYSCE